MTTDAHDAQPLPGLEALESVRPSGGVGEVEKGVRRTLLELAAQERLQEVDAGRMAVAVSLARVMGRKEVSGRASTFANDARLLVELLDALAGEAAPEGPEWEARLAAAMAEWGEAVGLEAAALEAAARETPPGP